MAMVQFRVVLLLREIEKQSRTIDGMFIVPAYLMEQLHNEVFPMAEDQKHEYTEVEGGQV